jgi:serine/threonine protein kinase
VSTQPQQIGRYEVIRELGRGGMATVYLAHDPHFNRDVAIKVLPPQFMHDPMFLARFKREAQTIAALEHEAIVPVYDFGESNGQPFLVMRYMPGGSLAERISRGPLPVAEASAVVQRIGSALDEAHGKGIVHRDLKPGNILFDHHGNAYLSDFGIVKLAESTATFTGSHIIGTPAYMSPEQAKGISDLDRRSDVYSLGVILFEMLTGQQPYHADTPMGVAVMHITEPVPSVQQVKADLSSDWETIISHALAKKREERFATANELATVVQALAEGAPPLGKIVFPIPKTEILYENDTGRATNIPTQGQGFLKQNAKWLWLGLPIFIILTAFLWANGKDNFFGQTSPTATSESLLMDLSTPTASRTSTLQPTSTRMPSQTPTIPATSTKVPETTKTSVPTSIPTATETPTPTGTATKTPVPAPELVAPPYGEYQSPITFKWRGTPGASYRVTLRHKSQSYVHTSNWIQGSEWTFDFPGEQFGEWEWFVTASSGLVSQTRDFVFNPFPGIDDGGNNPVPPTGYPPPAEPSPTDTPEPYPPVDSRSISPIQTRDDSLFTPEPNILTLKLEPLL